VGRLLIVLLIVLGAGLYFPQTREWIFERASPLLTPAYVWMTNQELGQIAADLSVLQGSRTDLPTRRGEFDAWMDRRYPGEKSRVDAWGTRYRLEVLSSRFRVISAGPDRTFGTDDDLSREAPSDVVSRTR
jgi:hypothetical protein